MKFKFNLNLVAFTLLFLPPRITCQVNTAFNKPSASLPPLVMTSVPPTVGAGVTTESFYFTVEKTVSLTVEVTVATKSSNVTVETTKSSSYIVETTVLPEIEISTPTKTLRFSRGTLNTYSMTTGFTQTVGMPRSSSTAQSTNRIMELSLSIAVPGGLVFLLVIFGAVNVLYKRRKRARQRADKAPFDRNTMGSVGDLSRPTPHKAKKVRVPEVGLINEIQSMEHTYENLRRNQLEMSEDQEHMTEDDGYEKPVFKPQKNGGNHYHITSQCYDFDGPKCALPKENERKWTVPKRLNSADQTNGSQDTPVSEDGEESPYHKYENPNYVLPDDDLFESDDTAL